MSIVSYAMPFTISSFIFIHMIYMIMYIHIKELYSIGYVKVVYRRVTMCFVLIR